jgi:hypothetical protein
MHRMVLPMLRIYEHRNTRPKRSNHNPELAVEAYFAVLAVVILGMIIGLVTYTVYTVIPELQRSHSPRRLQYPNALFESHSDERRQ